MAKQRKRRRNSSSSSPTKKRMIAKPKKDCDSILCFQDVWKDYFSNSNESNCDSDADVSNVFFELANAPSVSYRLEALTPQLDSTRPPASSDHDDETERPRISKTPRTRNNSPSATIVIQQDVSGAAQTHTGGIVWETSYLLLNYLLASNEWLKSITGLDSSISPTRTVLEIGAGCGMLGLTLHKAFALGILGGGSDTPIASPSRVVVTETSEVLGNLRSNMERNFPSPPIPCSTGTPAEQHHQLSVEELDWTRYEDDCAKAGIEAHSMDCIVGTDVVFSTRFVLPMLETMQFLSHSHTQIYLCLQERCVDSHRLLWEKAPCFGFCAEDISEQVYSDIALAEACRFGRALDCKLLKLTVVDQNSDKTKKKKKKKKNSK